MTVTDINQHAGLGLDFGECRVGVAVANLGVRFARPLKTLENPDSFAADVIEVCRQEAAAWVVVGRPRGLSGQETAQTARAEAFGQSLEAALQAAELDVALFWTDEALTSVKAEAELQARGKLFDRAEIDALAATYILEDFLQDPASRPSGGTHG